MLTAFLIFLGAGVGGVARYLVGLWAGGHDAGGLPIGTLLVNVLGCAGIGFAGAVFAGATGVREEHRLAITVGILGGFTTYSAFGYETLMLITDRRWLLAGVNVLLVNALGLAAVWIGARAGGRLFPS